MFCFYYGKYKNIQLFRKYAVWIFMNWIFIKVQGINCDVYIVLEILSEFIM